MTYNIGKTVEQALLQATQEKSSAGTLFRVRLNSRSPPAFDFTTKVPDVQIERLTESSADTGEFDVRDTLFIAEIGFEENGPELERSVREWLQRRKETRLAFLIKVHENPRFSTKEAFESLPEYIKADPRSYASTNISHTDGCVQVHGCNFVGRTKAYFEVWKRDPETGNAAIRGERIVSASSFFGNLTCVHALNQYLLCSHFTIPWRTRAPQSSV